ncbi:MAG: hypothetical protein ABFD89_24410 [Bryobacteraceae bacterium]
MDLSGVGNVSTIAQAWDEWVRCAGSEEAGKEKYLQFIGAVTDMLSGILPTWPDRSTVLARAAVVWDAMREKEETHG